MIFFTKRKKTFVAILLLSLATSQLNAFWPDSFSSWFKKPKPIEKSNSIFSWFAKKPQPAKTVEPVATKKPIAKETIVGSAIFALSTVAVIIYLIKRKSKGTGPTGNTGATNNSRRRNSRTNTKTTHYTHNTNNQNNTGTQNNAHNHHNTYQHNTNAQQYTIIPNYANTANEDCSTCLEKLYENKEQGPVVKLNGCKDGVKHKFHKKCIDDWFATGNNTCPLCRAEN